MKLDAFFETMIIDQYNPEFTSIELYQAYGDVSDMLELTEEVICRSWP